MVLNESFNIVMARSPERTGEIATVKELLADGTRAMIVGRADENRVVELGDGVNDTPLRSGDTVLVARRGRGEDVRKIVDALKAAGRDDLLS